MKRKKLMMTFWQVPFDGTQLDFRIQADYLTPRSKEKVTQLLQDWKIVAEGHCRKYELLIFSKLFDDRDKAREFVNNFPERLRVKGYNGKEITHF